MKSEKVKKISVIVEKVVHMGLIVITYHWLGVLEAMLWALVVVNFNLYEIKEKKERKQDD